MKAVYILLLFVLIGSVYCRPSPDDEPASQEKSVNKDIDNKAVNQEKSDITVNEESDQGEKVHKNISEDKSGHSDTKEKVHETVSKEKSEHANSRR